MRLPFPLAGQAPLILALAIGAWPERPAAQTPPLQVEVVAEFDTLEETIGACTMTPPQGEVAVAAVLNGEPITCREVDRRARLLLPLSKVGASILERLRSADVLEQLRKGLKTGHLNLAFKFPHPQGAIIDLQKQALAELVNDRLKLQAAKRLGIQVNDEQVEHAISRIAERHNMTSEQFARTLRVLDVNIASLREQLRADEAWKSTIAKLSRDLEDVERALTDPKAPPSKP